MSTVKIRIITQYYENYSDTDNPHWKPKNSFIFEVFADSDVILYAPNLEKILSEMVAEQSDSHNKFEYLEHEIVWHEPQVLSGEELENRIYAAHNNTQSI